MVKYTVKAARKAALTVIDHCIYIHLKDITFAIGFIE